MLKFISWILFLVIALVIAALSIANRETVTFSLDPLPFAFDLPLFGLLLAAGFIGLIIGSVVTWLRGHGVRHENRVHKREVEELKGRNMALTRDLEEARARGSNGPTPDALAPPITDKPQIEHYAGP
ncbi:LapA family protein [uncultured Sneathiella sp.]|uniref:LapA family protein n=1 Tax=uncultured Sneathiella sp. TaxID=879315 RepID=UPI002598E4A4|nr:LapA family protein [uncultured Sneathiella sp.]